MQETHMQESCLTEHDSSNGNNSEFADALFDAGAVVIAQLRQEWAKQMELMQAQCREMIAVMRADYVEDRHKFAEDQSRRLAEVKDGEPGLNGAKGDKGDRGENGERGEKGES